MESGRLSYKRSVISYYQSGQGPETLLCFHGYGEQARAFDFLGKQLGNQYTVLSIDLPFHGETDWQEGLLFTPEDLVAIINQLITPGKNFSLLGFSLGGRVALSLYQYIPERIRKIILLAPDGLRVNGWYWLATQTSLGNRFFAYTMRKPGWYLGMLRGLNRLRLINTSIYKFVDYYIGSPEVRQQLYSRWTSLRRLKPDLKKLKQFIRTNQTSVRLVYGRHDRIILPAPGEQFKKGLEEYCTMVIIASGHQVLHEKHAADIVHEITR